MYKFICATIAKPRIASSCVKLNQTHKPSHQECHRQASTSKNYTNENQDDVLEKDNDDGRRETSNRSTNTFPLVWKLPSFRHTIQPAPKLKMKEMPRFYAGNFLIVDSPTQSISKKYFHVYSINSSKRLFSTMNNKRFVNDASRENYRREMEQLSSIQRKKCDFQFRPMNNSTKPLAFAAESWIKKNKKKIYKTEICYPTHTIKHNLTLSKRYRIREGSVEKKVKELEDKFKHRKKMQMKMFKTKRNTYPTLVEHVKRKGNFNTNTVENKDPEKLPFQPSSELKNLKIELVKHAPEDAECQEADVSEALEDLIKSHPQIERASKEVKMKLKHKFMQLLINPAQKRQTPPPRTETNEATEKESEDLKLSKAEENVEEKYPNEVEETEQAPTAEEGIVNITTHPQMCNTREVAATSADFTHANTVWVEDGNNFDVNKVCIKETDTKIGSGLISKEYAREAPKPNYEKLNEEAQEVPNRVLKQKSAKCKPVKENFKPNYQQIEQEVKDFSNFIGKMKISKYKSDSNSRLEKKTNNNSNNKVVELKQEHLMDFEEMQESKLNLNENNNNHSPRIMYGQPMQKLQKWGNHPAAVMPGNKIKQAVGKEATKIENGDTKIVEPAKPPKPLIVDDLMKNQIEIREPSVDPRILMESLEEVTEVEELNDKAKATEQKFIKRKLRKEQQKKRNDIKDKSSSLQIQPRYDKSDDRLKEKVEIAKKIKRKIEELELVLDKEEIKAPKSRATKEGKLEKQEATSLEEITKYEEINNMAEKLIKKRKIHAPDQSFTVAQLNSKHKLEKNAAKIEENELKSKQDKKVKQHLEELTQIFKSEKDIMPETGEKDGNSYNKTKNIKQDGDNVEDIASYPEPLKKGIDDNLTGIIMPETGEKDGDNYNKTKSLKQDADNVDDIALYPIDDNLTKYVTPQTIHLIVNGQRNMAKKLADDDIDDIMTNDSIMEKSSIDDGILLKPGDEIVILESKPHQDILNSENTYIDSEVLEKVLAQSSDSKALQDTRSKIDMMLRKIAELEDMIKMQHVWKTAENMPRMPPPNYTPQIDKDKKTKNIKGDPRPKGHHDMILPPKKTAASEAFPKELSGNEVCEKQVSGNITQLEVKSVQSNLLTNALPGNVNKLSSLVRESIVKDNLTESDNLKVDDILLKDNGYFLNKINGPLELLESKEVAIPTEEGILQEVDAKHELKVEKYFETKFGKTENLRSSYSTVNVFNTIIESIPKNTKIEQVVAAREPKLSTKIIYSKTNVFASVKASLEKQVNDSKISTSKTSSMQNPMNEILAEKASTNQIPSKKASTCQNTVQKASTNQTPVQKASTNQVSAGNTAKKSSTNPIPPQNLPKKASTNRNPKVSVYPNHGQAKNHASTNRIVRCPPAKGKTLALIMQSHGRARPSARASSFPSKDNDITKIGIGESKTKYSSWSTQNFSSEKNASRGATQNPTSKPIIDVISSRKSKEANKPYLNKKSEVAQSDQLQTKSYLNAEASPQNENPSASKEEPLIEHSKAEMHKSIESQSVQLLHETKSKIDKDINIVWPRINENFKSEQSEASSAEDGWVLGLKQLLAVNQDLTNKNITPETNKQKQFKEIDNVDKLKESKKEDLDVDIQPELCNQKHTRVPGAILPENKDDIPCLADCNLCQANSIGVLNVTLPKLGVKPSLEGTKQMHQIKLSGHASEAGTSTTSARHAENFLKTKTPIKNVTEAKASNKDNKDKKAIFGFKSNGEVFIIKKADESFGEQKVMKSITLEPTVTAEDADLTFKIQKLANQTMEMPTTKEDSYIIDGLNVDQELITFNKNMFKRSSSESKVEQHPLKMSLKYIVKTNLQPKEKSVENDLNEEIMHLNRKYAKILKGIEQKLARKRQILEKKVQEIEEIKTIRKSSKENIANLEEHFNKAQKIEENNKIRKSLKNIKPFEDPFVEVASLKENTEQFEPAKIDETETTEKSLKNIETSKEKTVEVKTTPKVASMLRIKKVKNHQFEPFVDPSCALKEELKNVVENSAHPKKSLIDDTVLSTRPQTAQINRTAQILVERSKTEATKLRARRSLNLGKNKSLAAASYAQSKTSSEKQFVQKSSLQALKPAEATKLKELVTITTKVMSKEALESEIKAWTMNFNKNKRATSVQSVKVFEDPVKKAAQISKSEHVKPKQENLVQKEPESSKSDFQNTLEDDATSTYRTELMKRNIQRGEYRSKLEEKTHLGAIRFRKDYVANLNSQADEMVRKRKPLYRGVRRQEMYHNDARSSQLSIGNASWANSKLQNESSSNNDASGKRSFHNTSNTSKNFNRLMSKKEYLEFKRVEAEDKKKIFFLDAGNESVDATTVATEMVTHKNKYGEKEKQIEIEKHKSVSAKTLPEAINRGNSDGIIQKTPPMQIYQKTHQEKDTKPIKNKKVIIIHKKEKINYEANENINRRQARNHSGLKGTWKETEMEIYKNNDGVVKRITNVQKTESEKKKAVKPTLEIVYQKSIVDAEKLIQNQKKDRILNNTVKKIAAELKLTTQPLETEEDKKIKGKIKSNEIEIAKPEDRFANLTKTKKEKSETLSKIETNKPPSIQKKSKVDLKTKKIEQEVEAQKKLKSKVDVPELTTAEVKFANLTKTKKEKSETETNKTVPKIDINKASAIHKKSKVDLYKKNEEVEAQKKLKSKLDPPELTTDALNFKITKITKLLIDDMKLKKHADIQFLEHAKVDNVSSKDPVQSHKGLDKNEEKSKIMKTTVKSDVKPKVSESTRNPPHKLRKSATINLLEKIDSKTAPKSPNTKKGIEKEPKKVTQQPKSASLGNMVEPKETNTAVRINIANKDGKSAKKPNPIKAEPVQINKKEN